MWYLLYKICIRFNDYAGRYGGDEFLLVFPNCTKDNVNQII